MKDRDEVLRLLAGKAGRLLGVSSGILATSRELVQRAGQLPGIGFVVTKSYQVQPNPGNKPPILLEPAPGCFGNAVGLRNVGLKRGVAELAKLRQQQFRPLLIVSLAAGNIDDFIILLTAFTEFADALELNLSCPHASGYGASIGRDPQLVASYLRALRRYTVKPLIAKLTPNCVDIAAVASAAIANGADAISAINTVGPALYRERHTGEPLLQTSDHRGGKSGRWIQHQAVQSIRAIRAVLPADVPLIGIGGVDHPDLVKQFHRAGASAVAVGSVFARLPAPLWPQLFQWLQHPDGSSASSPTNHEVAKALAGPARLDYRPVQLQPDYQGSYYHRYRSAEAFPAAGVGFLWQPGRSEQMIFHSLDYCWLDRHNDLSTDVPVYYRGSYGAGGYQPAANDLVVGWGKVALWLHVIPVTAAPPLVIVDESQVEQLPQQLPRMITAGDWQHLVRQVADNLAPEGNLIITAPLNCSLQLLAELPQIAASKVYLIQPRQFLCGVGICGSCQLDGQLPCSDGLLLPLARLSDTCQKLQLLSKE